MLAASTHVCQPSVALQSQASEGRGQDRNARDGAIEAAHVSCTPAAQHSKGRHSTQLPPLLPPPTHLATVAVTWRVAEGGAGGEAGGREGYGCC